MARPNLDPVSVTEAFTLAEAAMKIRDIPFFLHGCPGVGKSDLVAQLAKKYNMELEILMLTQIDAQDLRGMPYPDVNTKRMVYYTPEFLPGPGSPPTILFLDELTGAEPRLQVSAYQLLLSRRIGSYHLPDNCYVCAAGNGPADGAVAYEMGTALASRMLHIAVQAEPRSWINWAMSNNIHTSIITLIQLKGDLLEQTTKQLERGDLLGPNPRAWANVSKVLHATGGNRAVAEPLVTGLVGKSAAADLFLTENELKDIPPAALLLDPNTSYDHKYLPKTVAGLYGFTYSMAAYVQNAAQTARAIKWLELTVENRKDLPAGDCMTYGLEMMLGKALTGNYSDEVMATQEFMDNSHLLMEVDAVNSSSSKSKVVIKKKKK